MNNTVPQNRIVRIVGLVLRNQSTTAAFPQKEFTWLAVIPKKLLNLRGTSDKGTRFIRLMIHMKSPFPINPVIIPWLYMVIPSYCIKNSNTSNTPTTSNSSKLPPKKKTTTKITQQFSYIFIQRFCYQSLNKNTLLHRRTCPHCSMQSAWKT